MSEATPCPCVLCRSDCTGHVNDDRRVHQGCRDKLRDALAEILELYALLGQELPSRVAGRGPKVSGSRDAPMPGNAEALNLRGPGARGNVDFAMNPALGRIDPATKADPATGLLPEGDQYGTIPVFAALETWERDWRESRGLAISGTWPDLTTALAAIVRFLHAHLDWACDNHDAIDDFADEVNRVRQAMKAARGDTPDSVYVGRCPTLVGDRPCGARLYASTWVDVIRCPQCKAKRERPEWEHLGKIMKEGGVA